jgi:hypothetical protein
VLRAALAGHIRRAVLGADSVPVNLGRASRVFTGAAREAAKLLAIQCDHPGCGLPAEWCQVDHSTEWHDDGRTDQDNAGVECGGHNRFKHRKRWRTKRDVDGRRHTIRADGTILLPVGARPPMFPDDRRCRSSSGFIRVIRAEYVRIGGSTPEQDADPPDPREDAEP